MVRSKLTDQDQQTLVRLYRESDATTTTLAEKFQVSPSTVTRILKDNISPGDYQELVSLKRSGARRKDDSTTQLTVLSNTPATPEDDDHSSQSLEATDPKPEAAETVGSDWNPEVELADLESSVDLESTLDADDFAPELHLEDSDYTLTDLDADLEDDLENDSSSEEELQADPIQSIQVRPLDDLDPPDICYVVIDRYHELTTRPLQEAIPDKTSDASVDMNMLPIFDNHRFARRFSEMSRRGGNPPHRVIQFGGYMLDIVRSQLVSKGITHLLIDGQVYSLQQGL